MKIVKYGDGASARPAETFLAKGNETFYMGGAVKLAGGTVEPSNEVTDPIYGICVGFVGADGNTPYKNLLAGQKNAGDTYVDGVSLKPVSGNAIGLRIKVVPVQPNDVIRGLANADVGATAAAKKVGNYINVSTTASSEFGKATATSTKEQFLIVGHPGKGSPRALDVKVVEGQIFGQ